MYFDLLKSSFGILYTVVYVIAAIAIPVILINKFMARWSKYLKAKFFAEQQYTVLEIKIPRNNTKSPVSMEIVFNTLYQGGKDYEFKKKYWTGEVRPWFSLEIASIDGSVHFYIWTKIKYKELLKNQLFSQYPDIEVNDIGLKDYTHKVYFDPENYEYWGCELRKKEASHVPIKTYTAYKLQDNPDEEFKIDPINPMMEFLGSLQKGEQVWIQICVRAHGKDTFDNEKGDYVDWKHEAGKDLLKRTKRDLKVDEKSNPSLFVLTKAEKQAADAIEDNITKTPFDVGIRAMYVAKKSAYRKSTIAGIANSFKQYNATNLNSFETVNATADSHFKYKWFGKTTEKALHGKHHFLNLYRHRSFFYSDYVPYGYHSDKKPSVFSAEELATIYHFPGQDSKTPTVERVAAKKAEAPVNLPI